MSRGPCAPLVNCACAFSPLLATCFRQEYDDQCKLLLAQKRDIMKKIKEHDDWCNNFDQLIGPFEAQYDACKATVKESYDFAKGKYKDSLQKLIDDFGYHPAFKRWFDDF